MAAVGLKNWFHSSRRCLTAAERLSLVDGHGLSTMTCSQSVLRRVGKEGEEMSGNPSIHYPAHRTAAQRTCPVHRLP